MPSITQRDPVCWNRPGIRRAYPDVDWVDENGPYEQHSQKTKRTSQAESECYVSRSTEESHHQGGEECPQLDGSNFLLPLAVERILPVTKSWPGKLIFPARDITWLRTTPAVSAVRNRLMKRAEITVIHASRFRAMGVQLTTFGMLASVCSFREKAENTRAAKHRKYLL
jgi:hypothetical protein